MAKIKYTNLDSDDLKVKRDPRTGLTWAEMMENTDNPNDVLFSIAFWQQKDPETGEQGRGGGNKFVGAVQSQRGDWTLDAAGKGVSGGKSWAEQAVESPSGKSDIYHDATTGKAITGVDYGQPGTVDDLSRAGADKFFYGTNMPTTGFNVPQITEFNRRLKEEVDIGAWRAANDVMFDIAVAMGKSFYGAQSDVAEGGYKQGNKFVGMLQTDRFSLTDPNATSWAVDYINSPNDEYPIKTPEGLLTGDVVKFAEDTGPYISGTTGGNGLLSSGYYTVPHMQTGGAWEGLGAEYQPGTIEGLGLLAGEAYAPYEPLRAGLLNATPEFMGTPAGFTPIDFSGSTDGDTTTTTNKAWTPTYQWGPLNAWGHYNIHGDWTPAAGQPGFVYPHTNSTNPFYQETSLT